MPRCRPERFPDMYENELAVIRRIDWNPFLKGLVTISSVEFDVKPALFSMADPTVAAGIAEVKLTSLQQRGEATVYCRAVLNNGETREVGVLQRLLEGGDF